MLNHLKLTACFLTLVLISGCQTLASEDLVHCLETFEPEEIIISSESFRDQYHPWSPQVLRDPITFVKIPSGRFHIEDYGYVESDGFYISEKELTVGQFYDLVSWSTSLDREEFAEWWVSNMSIDGVDPPGNALDYFLSDDAPMIGVSPREISFVCVSLSVACGMEFKASGLGEYLFARQWALENFSENINAQVDLILPESEIDSASVLDKFSNRWPTNAFCLSSLFDGPSEFISMESDVDREMAGAFLDQKGSIFFDKLLLNHVSITAGPSSFLPYPTCQGWWRDHALDRWLTYGISIGRRRWGVKGFEVGIRLVLRPR